jgi:subtilisin family serine protease
MSIVPGVSRAMSARSSLLLVLLSFVALALLAAAPASAESPDADPYIVVLEDDIAHPANVAHRHEENRGAKLGHIYGTAIKGYSAELTPGELKAIKQDPNVNYVEYDWPITTMSQSMSTGFQRIYAPNNSTLDIDEKDDVQVDVDVAVLDTGVSYHPDLRLISRTNCAVSGNYCVENSGEDAEGHGTHVAGIIGALDNSFGVVGVAPGARIWSVKVTPASGDGMASDMLAAVNWVTEHAGQIEVVNMSLGCDLPPTKDPESKNCGNNKTALEEAFATSIGKGVVYVASAGNDRKDVLGMSIPSLELDEGPRIPAALPDVITVTNLSDYDGQSGGLAQPQEYPGCNPLVGAVADEDDTLEGNSSWGKTVDIAAPGTCIFSTVKGGGYFFLTGTSQAAPHVSGAAAILAAKNNPNSRSEVIAIRNTLVANGNKSWTDDGGYKDLSGKYLAGPDGVTEPLLDVSNANVFKVPHPGKLTALGVTSNTAGAMQLFAATETGQIAAKDYNPYANPWGWQPWGDGVSLPTDGAGNPIPINGRPAVISRSSATRDIFIKGANNYLYFRHWDSNLGSWTSWFPMSTPNGQPVTSSPAAVRNPGIKDALSVAVRGNNGTIYMQNYDPSYGWSAWIEVGQPPGGAASSPTITVHNWNTYQVFVVGGDGALWQRAWHPTAGWSAWISLSGILTSAPATYVTNNQKDIYVFARGTDNAIWWRRWSPDLNYTWTAWQSLGGSWISAPAVTSRDISGVDVFAVGTDGRAQHRRYFPGSNTWTSWFHVDEACPPEC